MLRWPAIDRVFWLTDRKGRQVGVPTEKIAYVEIGTPDGGSPHRLRGLSRAGPPDDPAARPKAAVRHRQGRGRQDHRRGGARHCSRPTRASGRSCARSMPRATWRTSSSPAGPASTRREVSRNLFAMSMNTEESLKEYLSLQLKMPLLARIGPLARTFDFVANGRARGEGDPHRRQAARGRCASSTTTWWSSTRPPPATSSASWRRRRRSTSWCRSGLVRDQTGWMLDILGDPAQTGVVIVAAPEEMPVQRDDRARRPAPGRDRRRRWPPSS